MRQVRGGVGHQVGALAGLVVVWAVEAVDYVAACALRLEDGLAGDGCGIGGLGGRLQLLVDPGLEVGWAERHRLHPHTGVGQAAELGALPEVDALLVGGDLPVGDAARDGVTLAVQRRDPVAVDHVAAGDLELDLLTDRDHQLVGGNDVGGRQVACVREVDALEATEVVAVFPPPLLADHDHLGFPHRGLAVDGQCHGVVLPAADVHQGHDREGADHHQDQGRHDGPEDLEAEIAVDLFGVLLIAVVVVEPPPEIAGATEDDQKHHPGHDEDRVGE